MTRRFARPGNARLTSSIISPSAFTASATPHNFGNWADLVAGASVLFDVSGFSLVTDASVVISNTDTSILMEVGLGNTGNAVDKTILTGYPMGFRGTSNVAYIPLHVPAGVRMAARIQGTQVSETLDVSVILHYAPPPPAFGGFTSGEGLNVNSAASGFTHGDLTDNAWEQIVASTSVAYRAVSFVPQLPDGSATGAVFTVDYGMGAGGSEQQFATAYVEASAAEAISPLILPIPEMPIATGTRLALRKNTTSDCSGTLIGWR